MNADKLLKLQAYLDHELAASETERVAAWISGDEEAQRLFEELRQTKGLLSGAELDRPLPEAREFYWSKIEREITKQGTGSRSVSRSPFGFNLRWLRIGLPIAATAAAVAIVVYLNGVSTPTVAASFREIETPLAEANAISFHSAEAGMTVVWIDTSGN
jgi:anti-sigma factor RsiW